jgi:hypothetical protein
VNWSSASTRYASTIDRYRIRFAAAWTSGGGAGRIIRVNAVIGIVDQT